MPELCNATNEGAVPGLGSAAAGAQRPGLTAGARRAARRRAPPSWGRGPYSGRDRGHRSQPAFGNRRSIQPTPSTPHQVETTQWPRPRPRPAPLPSRCGALRTLGERIAPRQRAGSPGWGRDPPIAGCRHLTALPGGLVPAGRPGRAIAWHLGVTSHTAGGRIRPAPAAAARGGHAPGAAGARRFRATRRPAHQRRAAPPPPPPPPARWASPRCSRAA